nr:MAG TPA: hypothetical protein [Caudoviricetes sp.]
MSNFISIGIRNIIKNIKLHKYKYRDDKDYIKKIDEYERTLVTTLNEIENIELQMELNMKHPDNLSIHELTGILENGIGGLIYYYYGIKNYLSTVSNTLHNRDVREFHEISKLVERMPNSEEYSKFKKEVLSLWEGDKDVSED